MRRQTGRRRTALLIFSLLAAAFTGLASEGQPPRTRDKTSPDRNGKEAVFRGKTVSQWVELLEDKDVGVVDQAVQALKKLGPGAKTAVPALRKKLKSTSFFVRESAARVLGFLGPRAKAAVPDLVQLLDDKVESVRKAAIQGLAQIGPSAKAAVPALCKKVREDPELRVRGEAVSALGFISPDKEPVGLLVKMLGAYYLNFPAEKSLIRLGPPVVPAVVKALPNPAAFRVIAGIGPGAKGAVPAVTAYFKRGDQDPGIYFEAGRALKQVGSAARTAIPTLEKALREKNHFKNRDYGLEHALLATADALTWLDPKNKEAIGPLKKLLGSSNFDIRWRAAYALFRTDPKDEGAFRTLSRCLEQRINSDRENMIPALEELGRRGKKFFPGLKKVFLQPVRMDVQRACARALAKIDPEEARPLLIKSLKHDHFFVQAAAAFALGEMGPSAKDAVPGLTAALKDRDEAVRKEARQALQKIKKEP